jgi:hypothetical protein
VERRPRRSCCKASSVVCSAWRTSWPKNPTLYGAIAPGRSSGS